jgi:hypothetical protein
MKTEDAFILDAVAAAIKAAELKWKAENGGDLASCVDCPDETKAHAAIEAYKIAGARLDPAFVLIPAGRASNIGIIHKIQPIYDNYGQRCRLQITFGDGREVDMQPIGQISAREAESICRGLAGAVAYRLYGDEK